MTKTILRLTTSASLLVLTGVALLLANYLTPVIFSFYPAFSRYVTGLLAAMTSVLPIALWELLVVAAVLWFFITLIRALVRRRMVRWATGLLLLVSIVVTAFVLLWGLNYYAPPMEERLGLQELQYTPAQLEEATCYYRDLANRTALATQRQEDGTLADYDFDRLSDSAGLGYETLAQSMDCFDGSTVGVKKLLLSPLMGKIGTTGVFLCLTGESTVSTTTYRASMPFTMCHEIGHRMAFAREDEANFAAFLACAANSAPEFQYSGYYSAFRYCYSALSSADPEAAARVWQGVSAEVAADCRASAEQAAALRSETASRVSNQVYDTYLKSFSVDSGVQSYGEVTDLLLGWYFQRLR